MDVRTTRNFVCFAKKSVNAKPFLVRTIFCTHQIFANGTKLQRFRRLALEAVKILSGEKIVCSLTSIRHWVIKFCNIWITKRTRLYDFPRVFSLGTSVNCGKNLYLFAYFYRKWCWRCRWISKGEEVSSAGESDGNGSVFSAELKPGLQNP